MTRGLTSLFDLTPDDLQKLLARAAELKRKRRKDRPAKILKGKTVALIFDKPSTRTKVSFDVAVYELGGHSISLDSSSSQLGRGETYRDTGRVLSRYVDGIVLRTHAQQNIEDMAGGSSVPVINGLSDLYHPCQVITDLFTIREARGSLDGAAIAYVGDGNNMANTWLTAAMVFGDIFGFTLRVAVPKGYEASAGVLKKIDIMKGNHIVITSDPLEAVRGADVINTDTWFSMGQDVSEEKKRAFQPFQINADLLKHADDKAIVLHCLPAHRGEEITDEVMDGPQSRVLDQAENRLHVQKAILETLIK